jgi:phosphatidylinositol 3,5-bisphosphate 5-phosphatase
LIAEHIFRYVGQCYALLDACNDEAEPEDREIYERFVRKSKGIVEESNSFDTYVTYVETMLVPEDIGATGEDLVATYTQWLG